MDDWATFAAAQTAASAALAGLVLVGVSVNLERVLAIRGGPGRAGEALIVLFGLLVISTLALVPGQDARPFALEMLTVSILVWLLIVRIQTIAAHESRVPPFWTFPLRVAIGQLATLPFIIAAVALWFRGDGGLYWIVPGVIGSFLLAFLNAWVLLIEIDR